MHLTTSDWIQFVIAASGLIAVAGSISWGVIRLILAIGVIVREVSPNGGKSMKDRIAKLEISNAEQTKTLEWQNKTLIRIDQNITERNALKEEWIQELKDIIAGKR